MITYDERNEQEIPLAYRKRMNYNQTVRYVSGMQRRREIERQKRKKKRRRREIMLMIIGGLFIVFLFSGFFILLSWFLKYVIGVQ